MASPRNEVNAWRSLLLGQIDAVAHGFFFRHGGVSGNHYDSLNCGLGSNDEPDCVHENLARVAGALALTPANLVTIRQTHSTEVVVLEQVPGERPLADGAVTAKRHIGIGITGADCPTVLMVDPDAGVVGAAHAGWRGSLNGVVESTLERMCSLQARAERIVAAIGPGIQRDSYEVGVAFRDDLLAREPDCAHLFTAPPDCHFDLPQFIETRLRRAGVQQIERCVMDTYTEPALFSYRRSRKLGEPDYGRHLGVVRLR